MSLRARLLAAFAYALVVVIVALEVPLAANLNDRVNAEVEADSAAQAQVAAGSIADQLNRPARLDALTEEAARQLGGRVFVVDGRGRLLADSSDEIKVGSSVFANQQHPPLREALDGSVGQGTHPPDLDVLSTAVPIVRNGRTIGALEVEQSLDAVNDAVRDDVAAVIGIGLLALLLGLGVAWILAGSIARPLRSLAAVARRMASGDLRARASERGSREQTDLAHAFNEMAERIEGMVASQRAFVADASHQLRTPLTGLRLRLEAAGVKTSDTAVERELAAAEKEAGPPRRPRRRSACAGLQRGARRGRGGRPRRGSESRSRALARRPRRTPAPRSRSTGPARRRCGRDPESSTSSSTT